MVMLPPCRRIALAEIDKQWRNDSTDGERGAGICRRCGADFSHLCVSLRSAAGCRSGRHQQHAVGDQRVTGVSTWHASPKVIICKRHARKYIDDALEIATRRIGSYGIGLRSRSRLCHVPQLIFQGTPNLSITIAYREDQNVRCGGKMIVPWVCSTWK